MSKINLLFPVEITNRELDFRLFLAAHCTQPDTRIFIGQTDAIYRLSKNIQNGVYAGKNIFLHLFPGSDRQLHRYQTIKQNNFRLVHLDEEGGVMKGDEPRWRKWLAAKLDVDVLEADEKLCTWGNWQQEFYLSQNPACAANIQVTGHPRFDLYKSHLKSYYADDAKELQKRFGDFVLINTNFAWVNNRSGITRTFSERWNFDAQSAARFVDHVEEWGNNSLIFTNFVKLVAKLSAARPDLQFVLRPHPSEHIGFYRTIFKGVKNVHVLHEGSVGSWLLACRALIHDGCTTGLEAHFAGTPVITYKPIVDPRFDLLLPNLFGEKCFEVDEVLEAVQKTSERAIKAIGQEQHMPEARRMDENEKRASELIANFEIDSFAALKAVVAQAVEEKRSTGGSAYSAGKYQTWENLRRQLRAARTSVGLKSRGPRDEGMPDKFFQFEAEDIARRVERVQKILGVSFQHNLISGEMMTVES